MTIEPTFPTPRDLPRGLLDVRRTHLVAEIEQMNGGSRVWRRRQHLAPRRRVAALAVAFSLLVIGTAVAATTTNWLTGSPAPQLVTTDFGSYAPQLGFNPEPGRAVQVAQQADVTLYATTNAQGGYCLVASAPWKRPAQVRDGGTCVGRTAANSPLIAGVVGSRSAAGSNEQTFVVAGRTTDANAKTMRFADPTGQPIVASVGTSGFFIVSVPVNGSPCAGGEWSPVFRTLDDSGEELTRATVTLGSSPQRTGACVLPGPHA
jgi:hypothetical protein